MVVGICPLGVLLASLVLLGSLVLKGLHSQNLLPVGVVLASLVLLGNLVLKGLHSHNILRILEWRSRKRRKGCNPSMLRQKLI